MFKYLTKEYLEKFQKDGELFVGSIDFYRERSDLHEGRTTFFVAMKEGEEAIELSNAQANAITNDLHFNNEKLRFEKNAGFSSDLKTPNAFCYCVSEFFDRKVMEELKYDAFFRIINPKKFGEVLFRKIHKKVPLSFMVIKKIEYVPTKMIQITNENKDTVIDISRYNPENPMVKTIHITDFFTKTIDFEAEKEWRFLFVPQKKLKKKTIKIYSKELFEHCEFF